MKEERDKLDIDDTENKMEGILILEIASKLEHNFNIHTRVKSKTNLFIFLL